MEKKFILRVGHETFEPIRKNSGTLIPVSDGSWFVDAAKAHGMHYCFSGYLTEDSVPVGVKITCELGQGYGIDEGSKIIELRPGEKADFSYWGTSVDDEGDPEDFSVDYYLELCDWDEALLAADPDR